jgi:nitroimidazol reductase NimA-like FMN-containing flavoprotein (pyridoxamine 5'-phosphate oxidase superfamily)
MGALSATRVDPDEARRLFRDVPTLSLATVCPDGTAHAVPLWFVWLDDGVYVTSRWGSRAHRNVERDPRVTLSLDRGRAWAELAGVLVRGRAEVLRPDEPAAKRPLSAWFEKYRGELTGTQFGVYVDQVPNPVLFGVIPERVTGWSNSTMPARRP